MRQRSATLGISGGWRTVSTADSYLAICCTERREKRRRGGHRHLRKHASPDDPQYCCLIPVICRCPSRSREPNSFYFPFSAEFYGRAEYKSTGLLCNFYFYLPVVERQQFEKPVRETSSNQFDSGLVHFGSGLVRILELNQLNWFAPLTD